jgi:hypothetical protein
MLVRPWGVACLVVLAVAGDLLAQDAEYALAHARAAYNAREFGEAVASADEARRMPELAAAADLVAARALLERYRASAMADDLSQARERLRRLDASRLNPRERTEWLIGLGGALYFEETPGAAAVLFRTVLDAADLDQGAREHLLDWWATALDRDARARPASERAPIYEAVRHRMTDELVANPSSGTSAYWMAAAAVGEGDWDGAWHAAQAAWARAPLTAGGGITLRTDVERLVERAIIPARAKRLSLDQSEVASEWTAFKSKWVP